MELKYPTSIRDPIHGFIPLTQKERRLIDSRPFQRLRRIRQLAHAYLVYPGAVHTRFEHSVGTLRVASRMADHLLEEIQSLTTGQRDEILLGKSPDDFRRIVRIAALLHDIGHLPFGHSTEPVLLSKLPVSLRNTEEVESLHERITSSLIRHSEELVEILEEDLDDVVQVIEGKKHQGREVRFLAKEIVSGPVDSDKLDYLLRDSHYAGVKYGVFDLEKVIESTTIHISGPHCFLAIKGEGVRAIEQCILAKFFLAEQLYFHKVRVVTDNMLVRGLNLTLVGMPESQTSVKPHDNLGKLFEYGDTQEYISEFLLWHDERMMDCGCAANGYAGDLFRRIRDRRLLKLRLDEDIRVLTKDINSQDRLTTLESHTDEARKEEQEIAEVLGCPSELVIVRNTTSATPHTGREKYRLEPETVVIRPEHGEARKLSEHEPSILRRLQEPEQIRLQVIVQDDPTDNLSADSDRASEIRDKLYNLYQQGGK